MQRLTFSTAFQPHRCPVVVRKTPEFKPTRTLSSRARQYRGGWLGRWAEPVSAAAASVRSDIYYIGARYLFTPAFLIDGSVYRVLNAQHDTRATLSTVRTMYLLSKATAAYVQVGYLSNSSHARYSVSSGGGGNTPAAGTNQTGLMLGMRHLF